jgi:nitrogen regulatory protein P-II 1
MEVKNVVAFVREETREAIINALQEASIKGVTVTPTKGYGEYTNTFAIDLSNTCLRVDIMIAADRAEYAASILMDTASTGLDGDGLVAILPVDTLYRIKSKQKIEEFC